MSPLDGQSIRQLIDEHATTLVLYARQWCLNPDDAVQEALIELAEQAPPPRDPVAWLYTVTRRRAINLARSERRRQNHQHLAGAGKRSWFQCDPTSDVASQDVEQMLAGLQAIDREIVIARIWGDLSFEQIASLLGRTTSSVHRRYHAAIATLQRKLNPENIQVEESI